LPREHGGSTGHCAGQAQPVASHRALTIAAVVDADTPGLSRFTRPAVKRQLPRAVI
jgi:hypothetical protein